MKQLILRIESITPLFLAGEDQTSAELRAPSFRGLLRYWFRAMMGGVMGDDDLSELRDEVEGGVFGDTKRASRLMVRVRGDVESQPFQSSRPGLQYLFFSMLMQDRACFPAGTHFRVTVQNRGGAGFTPEQVMAAGVGSLWLLVHLGGLGSRARRGGGNLKVSDAKTIGISLESELGSLVEALLIREGSLSELKSHLEGGLRKVKAQFGGLTRHRAEPSERPDFTIVHPKSFELHLLDKTWGSCEDALDEVGKFYRDFRRRRPLSEKRAFGLPLLPRYRDERLASPLTFRVLPLVNEAYAVVVSVSRIEGPSSFKIIDEFIEELDREIGALEVAVP